VGARFANAPEFKQWHRQVAGSSGILSDNVKGLSSPAVRFAGGVKTLLTGASDTSAGAMVWPEVQPFVPLAGRRPLTLKDIITVVPVNTDSVQFAKQDTETNAAASVAEATATSGTSGTKPESAMSFATVTVGIKTIAHWLPATKRALSDAPALRALIDEFLLFGVNEELARGSDGVG
jgi:HK97 family phage major capsid protein